MTSVGKDTAPLIIHVLDVGHGDSIVIEFPGGLRFGIIDCNLHPESNRGFEHARPVDRREPKALTFFRDRKARDRELTVEFACLTHPHSDHFRGFRRLLEGLHELGVPVRQFWDSSGSTKKARAYQREAIALAGPVNLRDADEIEKLYAWVHPLAESRPDFYKVLSGPMPQIYQDPQQDIHIDVLAPDFTLTDEYGAFHSMHPADNSGRDAFARRHPHVRDDNTISSAVLVRYGRFRAILGGDVTNKTWERVMPAPPADGCHAVKMSHHGSEEGNYPAEKLLCEHVGLHGAGTAVISGGYRDKLPAERMLQALRKRKIRVFRTGAVVSSVPYTPRHARADEIVCHHVSVACRTVVADSFHGNIAIRGYADGGHEVVPQCKRPRRRKTITP